ncbi:MAG: peptidase M28, partial [Bacteroidota bacterium]
MFFIQTLAQNNPVIDAIIKEGTQNSALKRMGHELMDQIGPRLVGTPQMQKANDWAVNTYAGWGIQARNEAWGQWKDWERGITHLDMLTPRLHTIECTQLAWSPSTKKRGVKGEAIILPDLADSSAYAEWMKTVKGKMVMISMPQPTGRPDYNWQEFALKESFDKMKKERLAQTAAWRNRISKTRLNFRQLVRKLEDAGAIAILTHNWS